MSKIFTTSDGRELKLGFSDDLDNNPEIKSAKLSLPKKTEDLIQKLYKKVGDEDNKQNPVLEKTLQAYQKVVDQDSDNADLWLEQLQSQLKEKEKLTKERNNVFSNGDKAYAARNAAPIPTLEAIEGIESALYLDPIQEKAFDEEGNPKTIRQYLREKDEIGAIKNKYISRTLIKTIEATKLDVASDMDTNERSIAHLLSGQVLTPDQELEIREETELHKNRLAEVAEIMTGWLIKPRDPREVETSFFGGSIYKEIHEDLQNAILSNPSLHPELSNPFLQRLKAAERGEQTLTAFERELLGQYSDEEDKAHKAARKRMDDQLKEANEEFYKNLQKHSDKEQDMIPGRMLRMLLMANPFMGGILGGITLLGPLANVLSGAMDFNDVVLSPIKFCFNLGKLGDLGVGDAIAAGLKTGIEESRIFNIPNSIVNLATDNSIAHSIFGSAGGAITGPMTQLGLAGVAMFYEADETLQFAVEKDATKAKFKEKFEKIHKDFAKNLDKRRKEKIDQFAKECEGGSVGEKLSKDNEISKLLSQADNDKLSKIVANKLGIGDFDTKDLRTVLGSNINKAAVQDLLLLAKHCRESGDSNNNKFVDAVNATKDNDVTKYNSLLQEKKSEVEKAKKATINQFYESNLGEQEDKFVSDQLKTGIPKILGQLNDKEKEALGRTIKEKLKLSDLDPKKLAEVMANNIDKPEIQNLLLATKGDKDLQILKQALASTTEFDEYLKNKKDDIKEEKTSLLKQLYGLSPSSNEDDLMQKRRNAIVEKHKNSLTPYLNYSLKEKPEKEVKSQDDAQAKKEKDTKKDHDDALSSSAPSASMPKAKTADPAPPIKTAINPNNNGNLSAQASVNQYSEESGISASATVATGLPASSIDQRKVGGSASLSAGQVDTAIDPTKLPSKNKDTGRGL